MFGPQRHENLAAALPVPLVGSVVDLGCGKGATLAALAVRLDPAARLLGVDADKPELTDEGLGVVVADLNEPLPFAGEEFDAAVCQNVIECLLDPPGFLAEVAASSCRRSRGSDTTRRSSTAGRRTWLRDWWPLRVAATPRWHRTSMGGSMTSSSRLSAENSCTRSTTLLRKPT